MTTSTESSSKRKNLYNVIEPNRWHRVQSFLGYLQLPLFFNVCLIDFFVEEHGGMDLKNVDQVLLPSTQETSERNEKKK